MFLLSAKQALLPHTYRVAYTQPRLRELLDVQLPFLVLIQTVELRFHKLHPLLLRDFAAIVGIHDLRSSVINFRIAPRRWCSASTSRCRPSRSPLYHSSRISSAHRQMVSGSISSALVSAGSNTSHAVTPSYTQLFAYAPRRGESGNVHSPALKQYP